MNRLKINIKKSFCIFVVMLLSLNNYAAVVSDNDGTAFISKAEFDSQKNNFQSEIDNYNKNIDGKITAAIVSYLEGVKSEETSTLPVYYANWETVTGMNYAPKNVFRYPNVVGSFVLLANAIRSGWSGTYSVFLKLEYNRPSSTTSQRLLVDAGQEVGSSFPDKVVWQGRALNFVDSLTASRVAKCFPSNGSYAGVNWDVGLDGSHMDGTNVTKFGTGFFPNLDTVTQTFWYPRFYWYARGDSSSRTYREITDYFSKASSISISLKEVTDSEGNQKTKDYEHIIMWKSINFPEVTDIDWVHTLRSIPSSASLTKQGLLNSATKSGNLLDVTVSVEDYGYFTNKACRITPTTALSNIYSGDYGLSDATTFVTAGIVNKTYVSEKIEQTTDKFSQTIDGVRYAITQNATLRDGFVCFAAKRDDKITWTPYFTNMQVNDVSQNFDMNVVFATAPFTNESSVSTGGQIITWTDDAGVVHDVFPTDAQHKCDVKFKMPVDGIVYCKWYPVDTTIRNSRNWRADLDLTKCKTYKRTYSR